MTDPSYTPPPGYEEYARPPVQTQPGPRSQGPYQQGPYQQGPYSGAPQPWRPTSVTAVLGLVLAVLVSPVGLVVSLFGLGATARGRRAGRGLAVAGVVVGALGTVLWVLAVVALVAVGRTAWQTYQDVESQVGQLPAPSDLPSWPSGEGIPSGQDGAADVVVDSCGATFGVAATGALTITNSTGAPASYVVRLVALDADGQQVGGLAASSDAVEPGATAQVQAFGVLSGDGDVASCEVAQAVRSPR